MADKKIGAPLLEQVTPRRNNQRTVYHKRSNVSIPEEKPWNPRGVVLAFCIGIVVGLIIGIIAATTIDSSIREFNENPHGAVQMEWRAER